MVRAQQVAIEGEGNLAKIATAKITILYNGILAYQREIPYHMLLGKNMLALQVYTMQQSPKYMNKEFRAIMLHFVLLCDKNMPGYTKVSWYGRDPHIKPNTYRDDFRPVDGYGDYTEQDSKALSRGALFFIGVSLLLIGAFGLGVVFLNLRS
ncbi:MAG: hypothetical protein NT019_03070 [Candidatus Adlerbacteria bacterium]|nr:hypothetical protein [Candidatus Adlerbacteria bacterium]